MGVGPISPAAFLNYPAENEQLNAQRQQDQFAQQQRPLLIQQLAGQVAIQKQIQAENQLKLEADARDRNDDNIWQQAVKDRALKKAQEVPQSAPAAPVANSDDPGEPGQEVSGTTPVAQTAPVAPSKTLTDEVLEDPDVIGRLSARGLERYQKINLDQKKAMLDFAKTQSEEQRAKIKQQHESLGGLLSAVRYMDDPVQKQALWDATMRQAPSLGLSPDMVGAFPKQVPGNDYLDHLIMAQVVSNDGYNTAAAQATAAEKQAQAKTKLDLDARQQLEEDKKNAAARLYNAADADEYSATLADITKKTPDVAVMFPAKPPDAGLTDTFRQTVLERGMNPAEVAKSRAEAKKQADVEAKAAAAANVVKLDPEITASLIATGAKDPAHPTSAEMEKGLRRLQQLKVSERPVSTTDIVTPEARSNVAEMIANYQAAPPSGYALSRPEGQNLMAEVKRINPNYQQFQYQIFQDTEKAFTSGTPATKANALNTMMGHLSVIDQAADALNNGDIQVLNRLGNTIGVQLGQTPVTTYQAIVNRLAPEIGLAYVTGGGTAGERGTNAGDFDPKMGAKQIKANIGVAAQLADSKIKALQDQYQRGTYGRGTQKLISDDAEAARQRLVRQSPVGQQPPTIGTKADFDKLPSGTVYINSKDGKQYRKP